MKTKLFNILVLVLTGTALYAQDPAAQATATGKGIPQMVTDPMNFIIAFAFLVLVGSILVMLRVIRLLTNQLAPRVVVQDQSEDTYEAEVRKPSFWTRINEKLNDSVPVEKEADVLLDHNYDGIKELDNNLPPWWKYGFYLTIVFAVIYMIDYHVVGAGNVQLDEYNAQLKEAELQKQERLKLVANNVDENTVTLLTADASIANGQKIYTDKCLVCHGKLGEGLVGPNLTDDYWLHGGKINDIFKTIKYGVTTKGMLAWQGQLTPVQIQEVASFIKTLHGTNPPNQKEPQGEIYKESAAGSDSTTVATDSTAASTDSLKIVTK
jgi:cytochrome c oxidase cbb3-type subunit 3